MLQERDSERRLPRIQEEADLETLDRIRVEAAPLQVFARARAVLRIGEQLFKERAGCRVRFEHCLPFGRVLLIQRPRAATSSWQLYVVFIRELPKRFDKSDAIALHHEVDRVAAFLAAEALEILLRRIDVKRGRLL